MLLQVASATVSPSSASARRRESCVRFRYNTRLLINYNSRLAKTKLCTMLARENVENDRG
jgi:hypothetical protein